MTSRTILLGQLREVLRVVPRASEMVVNEIAIPVPSRRSIDPRATVSERAALGEQVRLRRADRVDAIEVSPLWIFEGYVVIDDTAMRDARRLETHVRDAVGERCLGIRVDEVEGNAVKVWLAVR